MPCLFPKPDPLKPLEDGLWLTWPSVKYAFSGAPLPAPRPVDIAAQAIQAGIASPPPADVPDNHCLAIHPYATDTLFGATSVEEWRIAYGRVVAVFEGDNALLYGYPKEEKRKCPKPQPTPRS